MKTFERTAKTGRAKARSLFLYALLFLLLSGCIGSDDLMQAPRPAIQYQRLQGHIDILFDNGYVFSAPNTGEYRQAVMTVDLSHPGSEEAVVFLRRGETESLLAVFIPGDGDFVALTPVAENADAVHSVVFRDLTGSGRKDIIVGWQVGVLRFISVYSLDGGGLTEIFTRRFTGYEVYDIESSGIPALLLVQLDAEEQIVEMVSFRDGELSVTDTAALSRGAEALRRIRSGPLLDGPPGLYVASQFLTADGEVTDIFTFRDGALVNITASMETGVSEMLVRPRQIPAEDIDGDGVLDLPRHIELPFHPGEPGAALYEIRWTAYESGGLSVETARTYHSAIHSWYILLPEQWPERYAVMQSVSENAETVTVFSIIENGGDPVDFLRIFYLSQPAGNRPPVRDRTVLIDQDNLVVTAEILPLRDGPVIFEMSEPELKELFNLIPIDWRGS